MKRRRSGPAAADLERSVLEKTIQDLRVRQQLQQQQQQQHIDMEGDTHTESGRDTAAI
jgi:hypothetical protein